MPSQKIASLLGDKADYLLNHQSKTISRDLLHLPGPDFIDRIWINSDRSSTVLRNLQLMYNTGRLGNSGYLSILPVDQGISWFHSASASSGKKASCTKRARNKNNVPIEPATEIQAWTTNTTQCLR